MVFVALNALPWCNQPTSKRWFAFEMCLEETGKIFPFWYIFLQIFAVFLNPSFTRVTNEAQE